MSRRLHHETVGALLGIALSQLVSAQVGQVPAEAISGASLDALMAQLRSHEPLGFSGIATLYVPADPMACSPCIAWSAGGGAIPGVFEFRTQDEKYYESVQMDPLLAPGLSCEAAYDGQEFQLLLATGTLTVGAQDSDALLPMLPDPLAELGSFLRPLTDANADRRLRYRDVQEAARQSRVVDTQWSACQVQGQSGWCTDLPGGTYEGQDYVFRIYVTSQNNGFPARIERVGPAGDVLTRSDFLDYVAVRGTTTTFRWPQRVLMRSFDGSGTELVRIEYELTDIRMGPQSVAAGFRIDCGRAARVWSDTQQQFVP